MMKKILPLLILPFCASFLSSCSSCSKMDTVKLTYGELTYQKYHTITYSQLSAKIDQKESFLLVVDPQGCGCFGDFLKASQDYFKAHSLLLYRITVKDFNNQESYGLKIIDGSTTFAIFNQGEVQQVLVSNSSEEMSNKEKFEEYISSKIFDPNMFYIHQDELESLYHKKNTKSLIYFARSRCGDCSYINGHFLYEYMRGRSEKMYVFDGDEIRYDEDGNEHAEEWKTFKENYGLTIDNNPTYGFDTGVVPTFMVVGGDNDGNTVYYSGAVAFNDQLTDVNESTKAIGNNYFTAERVADLPYSAEVLTGKQVSAESVSSMVKYHETMMGIYEPNLRSFFEHSFSQTTFIK